jgi:hypothetical protein
LTTTSSRRIGFLAAACTVLCSGTAIPATVLVSAIGDDGWASGDTRATEYLDVHGDSQVVSGRTATEDTLIADRIAFVSAPGNPPLGTGALRLMIDGAEDKATLALLDLSDPFAADISFEYAWFVVGDGMSTVAAPAIKLGINTTEANSSSDLSIDRGEDSFDKILVYEPYFNGPQMDDTWTPVVITPSTGRWWLVNLDPGSALPPGGVGDLRTLDQWVIDFAAAGLAGATMTSLQIGVGSGNPAQESYVDYLIYSNSGQGTATTWDFDAPLIQVTSSTGTIHVVLSVLLGLLGVWALSRPRSLAA